VICKKSTIGCSVSRKPVATRNNFASNNYRWEYNLVQMCVVVDSAAKLEIAQLPSRVSPSSLPPTLKANFFSRGVFSPLKKREQNCIIHIT
jgi:hypothetical protein